MTLSKGGPIPQSPTAQFEYGWVPYTVTLDASNSVDPDGNIVNYDWNFGDSTPTVTGQIVNHTYTTPGQFTITLTVTDDQDATMSVTQEVITGNP